LHSLSNIMVLINLSHITIILAGMLIMTCLGATLTFFLFKRISRRILSHSKHSTPLRWWAGILFLVLMLGFLTIAIVSYPDDPFASLNLHIVAIDMLILPLGAIVMVLLVAPQHITWARVLGNIVPFIVLCPWCIILNQVWYTYMIAIGMVGYILAMMIYTMVHGVRYERAIKDEYSSLQGRSVKWLFGIVAYMGLVLLNFLLFTINHSRFDGIIYFGLNLIAWNIAYAHMWQTVMARENAHSKELDVDEMEREKKEEKERGPLLSEDTESFTNRLTELIEKDKIYSQDDLTRDDLARLMGMSHTNFTKLLKETTGQSFYEYINSLRIDTATQMIKEGKMDVWSIGQAVGYRYRSTYYRAFAAKHNCTPAEYTEKEK